MPEYRDSYGEPLNHFGCEAVQELHKILEPFITDQVTRFGVSTEEVVGMIVSVALDIATQTSLRVRFGTREAGFDQCDPADIAGMPCKIIAKYDEDYDDCYDDYNNGLDSTCESIPESIPDVDSFTDYTRIK